MGEGPVNTGRSRASPDSAAFLRKIKDAVNLIDVVAEHVVLRKTGTNHVGLCPFHSERSPSFYVSEAKQLYNCHGCKKGGDLVRFVQDLHGVSFREAVEELAERARIPLPGSWGGASSDNPQVAAQREKLSLALRLNRFAAGYFHQMLSTSADPSQYLARRGVGGDWIREFYIGWAPDAWEGLASFLTVKKAPLALAAELGLIRPSQKGGAANTTGYFDLFRGRVMFPILDTRGKVVAFGGRTLPSGKEGADTGPKYLNSPESSLFQKSRVLYGLYQAQRFIREKDEAVIVEGYFDVIALHAVGIRNVVATCGTSLTAEHLKILQRFASRVTVLFDGDKAGIAATERAMVLGLQEGLVLRGFTLPDGQDPDEAVWDEEKQQVRPGAAEQLQSGLAGARALLEIRIEEAMATSLEGPEARTRELKRIASWLAQYRDPIGKAVWVQTLRDRWKVEPRLLELAGAGSVSSPSPRPIPRKNSPTPVQGVVNSRPIPLSAADRLLLQALLQGGKATQALAEARAHLPKGSALADLWEHPVAREWVAGLARDPAQLEVLRQAPDQKIEEIVDPAFRQAVTEMLVHSSEPIATSELEGAIRRQLRHCWARISHELKSALTAAEVKKNAVLHRELMQEYLDVQRKIEEFGTSI